jgi:putative ABC transport system substrate-binding protein
VRRREFIVALGGAAAMPFTARAQSGNPTRRIAVLTNFSETDSEAKSWHTAFRRRLENLGWIEGRNLQLDVRWGDGNLGNLRTHAVELMSKMPHVILADSTPSISAMQEATKSIPIVFVGGSNPVGSGFVASLARPGGNITGFISFEPAIGGKWLDTLHEMAPPVTRVALIYNPRTHTGQYFSSIEAGARVHGIELVRLPFSDFTDIERGVADLVRQPNTGLLNLSDPSVALHRDQIVALAARHRLPAVYPFRFFVVSGGLISYGVDRLDQYRRAAEYVSRILKGESPADLPVQVPLKYELAINLKAAKEIGLAIPPTLLARADEVIE